MLHFQTVISINNINIETGENFNYVIPAIVNYEVCLLLILTQKGL